jgi:glutamine---fructose-6-phosphate transaminase (isomerizing)
MCGIVGILGDHEAAPIMVEALKRLEYRGYDSAGIATVNGGRLDRRRAVGKLVEPLRPPRPRPLRARPASATPAGPPTARRPWRNAHPHQCGPVAVVHNGIIENFRTCARNWPPRVYATETETDTETVALLCPVLHGPGPRPPRRGRQTLARLDGAFALAFLFEGEDDLIVAARRGSPLAIGHGDRARCSSARTPSRSRP